MALPLTRTKTRPRALIASASQLAPTENSRDVTSSDAEWQSGAFRVVKVQPELNYASRFYSRLLRRLRIYPAMRDSLDRTTAIETGLPVELLDRIQDPGGGRSQILGSYGRLMFISAEGYLFGRDLETDTESWSFVSTKEISQADGKIFWKQRSNSQPIEYIAGSQAVVYRMWTPDPEFSGDAESPMRSVLEIAGELSVLTKAVKSTAISRMLHGMLKVPAELSFGGDTEGLEEDAEEHVILRTIIDHVTGATENPEAPESSAPLVIEGAAEFLAALEWVSMHDAEKDYMEKDLRVEAIRRMALGLDLPPELLLGLADANHWGARQIIHAAWQSHGANIAEQFCDDLADAYLRPALREQGFADWRKVVIAYDDADVVVSPDRSDDAHKAYVNGEVSGIGYRKLIGVPEEFAPSEEERRVYLAVKLRDPAFLDGTKYEVQTPQPGPAQPGPQPNPAGGGTNPEITPPEPGPSGTSRRESRSLAIRVAAELAIQRCREVAGARVRSKVLGKADLTESIDGIHNHRVCSTIGRLPDLPDPLQLVASGASGFVALCSEWAVDDIQAQAMGQMIEVHAARTLYDERVQGLPAGLAAAIDRAYETSLVRRNNESLELLTKRHPELAVLT